VGREEKRVLSLESENTESKRRGGQFDLKKGTSDKELPTKRRCRGKNSRRIRREVFPGRPARNFLKKKKGRTDTEQITTNERKKQQRREQAESTGKVLKKGVRLREQEGVKEGYKYAR